MGWVALLPALLRNATPSKGETFRIEFAHLFCQSETFRMEFAYLFCLSETFRIEFAHLFCQSEAFRMEFAHLFATCESRMGKNAPYMFYIKSNKKLQF
ncbi:MAG: hypothetical protein LBK94_07200 [Prevotellaceae bacterium]|nr:hypothetical protein [Prevotellaceae bacterium]